ncbi:MAG TPA: aldehyde dehydrogenase family protein [Bacteroidia bacterium]|nr:aldehyde dehydrogenase family protein [Bacteroidia bacterium]
MTHSVARLPVQKTYKIYIDGKFPRTESGRYYKYITDSGVFVANICRCSRKDFRDAVTAARLAFAGWSCRSAYNRGQILYRIAETLEGRRAQFEAALKTEGVSKTAAAAEVGKAIDLLIYYAGWTDKFQQLFSSVNPVASAHFNFSYPEPSGVVAVFSPYKSGLLGLVASVIPAIAGGNTVVALAATKFPLTAIDFAEVVHTSDVPPGVFNVLTGFPDELLKEFASHKDVNAFLYCNDNPAELKLAEAMGAENIKRVIPRPEFNKAAMVLSPYPVMDLQEIKTTWHPVGM